MGTSLLRVTDLQSGYDGGKVLNGLTLTLEKSEVVAIIGRNGVGKTTFMRTLIGILDTDAGSIELDGKNISVMAPDERARAGLGYVPQGREIFPGLTVEENMKVGLQILRSGSAKDMDMALNFFPVLRTKLQQKAGTMSGGEQQQLAIARVLVGRPRVLLLDEPSEGIQPSIVQAIAEKLVEISSTLGLGILLVEQNMNMVEMAASRCCVMDKGRVVQHLSKDQLNDDELMRRHLAV
ncbi:MAG: ABC transporter ATP-binding protein [Burkholderiaceae bacterium]|jgi:branched-chain amino acid transport system ATP-binding protein